LELDDGSHVIPVRKKRKVLIFGDSITQGYTTWLPENSYASRISRWLDADMINKAIGGEKYWPELANVPDDGQPDLILVAYGANDWNEKTEEEFAANSRAFCSSLRKAYPETKIIVLSTIWMSTREAKQHERWPFANLVLHLKALEHLVDNLFVIDGTNLVPNDLACFAEDHVHPNDVGFRYYAHALQEKIKNLI
jgi:lysophospholipase L1-like esterase